MIWKRAGKNRLKTVWEIRKGARISYLVGTAHFFPHSFRLWFQQLMESASAALFEGPLDEKSLQRIRESGMTAGPADDLFAQLDRQTVARINEKIFPGCRRKTLEDAIRLSVPGSSDPLGEMVAGMKPWLAFFTLWSAYLERFGWRYSVDLEAHDAAREKDCEIVAMESVEEQVAVLEGLSTERIVGFLQAVGKWDSYRRNYERHFLAADLDKIRSTATGFPSRHRTVIDGRDETFFNRMKPYLDTGGAVACVGVPHVPGICELLKANGFQIAGPSLPEPHPPVFGNR